MTYYTVQEPLYLASIDQTLTPGTVVRVGTGPSLTINDFDWAAIDSPVLDDLLTRGVLMPQDSAGSLSPQEFRSRLTGAVSVTVERTLKALRKKPGLLRGVVHQALMGG